jgi:hypothetical protein
MTINSRTTIATTPGLVISMVGVADILLGLCMALWLDGFLGNPTPIIAGITIGQLVGLVMVIGGAIAFLFGRQMGWTQRGKGNANASNNPVKRM